MQGTSSSLDRQLLLTFKPRCRRFDGHSAKPLYHSHVLLSFNRSSDSQIPAASPTHAPELSRIRINFSTSRAKNKESPYDQNLDSTSQAIIECAFGNTRKAHCTIAQPCAGILRASSDVQAPQNMCWSSTLRSYTAITADIVTKSVLSCRGLVRRATEISGGRTNRGLCARA